MKRLIILGVMLAAFAASTVNADMPVPTCDPCPCIIICDWGTPWHGCWLACDRPTLLKKEPVK